jgi:beta-lactamase superfamily II metal-dependent hydrolase
MERRSRRRITLLAALGFAAGILSLAIVLNQGSVGEASTFPARAYLPQLARDAPLSVSGFSVDFIDVGQGDATLITVGGQRLLIDGGRPANLVVQRLQSLGVTDLDVIVATHPDADHVGGLAAVLAAYSVERIYINGDPSTTQTYTDFLSAALAEGAQVITPRRGETIAIGGLQLAVLNPASLTSDTNNDSIVLRLTCGAVSVQFEGDAEAPAEQSMLAAGQVTDVDVLKVGHHGSSTASSLAFLQATKPEVAVISAGLTNPYGHPAPEVVSRLQGLGVQLVYTDTASSDDTKVMTSNCQTYSFSSVSGGGGSPTPTATTTVNASPTPTRTSTPTQTVVAFDLPACYQAGTDTCNCSNFTTHAWAQWFHDTYDPGDVNRLDADHDGVVCESLP